MTNPASVDLIPRRNVCLLQYYVIPRIRVLPLKGGLCSVRGSEGRPEDDTRDPGRFPISQDLGEGWKGGSEQE